MDMINDSSLQPRYEQMYRIVRERILAGQYQVGERIPSEKELIEEFGVSRITSKKALDMLVQEGMIHRQPGRGSFVTRKEQQDDSAVPAVEAEAEAVATARSGQVF